KLPTPDNPICSFTFFNLGRRTISSVQITVTCFDAQDQVLSRRVERPMALGAVGRETFAVEIFCNLPVEAIDLAIDKTWFTDGSEWRRASEARLIEYKPNELPPNRRLEQLRYIAGSDAVGYPSDQGAVWICVCGRVNAAEEQLCRRCSRDREEVFERFAYDAVQRENDNRERALQQKARLAREEASQQEFIRQTKARRKRRNRRIRTGVSCAAIIIAGVVYLFIVLGLPEIRYQTALSSLSAGDPARARDEFQAVLTYRDTPAMINECDLQIGLNNIRSGNLDSIEEGISLLTSLGDYPGASEAVLEGEYQKATVLLDSGEYVQASALFAAIPEYRDAEALYKKAEYLLAAQEMAAKEYDSARVRFLALGPLYSDALAKANDCVYLPAKELMLAERFDEAAAMFETIPNYSDAGEQRKLCVFQSGSRALLDGEYERAAVLFLSVDNYTDAGDWVKNSVYSLANQMNELGEYENARSLYAKIPTFEDAGEQIKETTYLPAQTLQKEEKYEEAAALFAEIPGFKDADTRYGECVGQAAKIASDMLDYAKAIELYQKIDDYDGIPKLLTQTRFNHGDQLLEAGDFDAAIRAYESIGEEDTTAAERILKARYQKAEKTFEDGDFNQARMLFTALGDYSDAADRTLDCSLSLALANLDIATDDLEQVYHAFVAIGDGEYEPALQKAAEISYLLGERLEEAGDLDGAYAAYDRAGNYSDAADRRDDCIYKRAQALMDGGSYQEAGELFDSVIMFRDARTKRDECYDTWLAIRVITAQELYNNNEFAEVVELLSDVNINTIPKAYENVRTLYVESNYKVARKLIDDNRALEAYTYLLNCKGHKRNADELLNKTIYRILGTWETGLGVRYAFYLDGTCSIAGQEKYFNMLNPYGIYIGDSAEDLVRTFSFSSGSGTSMSIRVDSTGETLRLTRIRDAEFAPSEDTEGGITATFIPDEIAEEDVPGEEPVAGGEA
ncbi:MAG: soluble NSF attachment family protein, partial [Clostridia bacterium]|nr:soluble NSF attachment family protein [Clostridia bacterium]